MKGVLLTNGRMAVAYRVEHLLDRDDLTSLLASTQRYTISGDELPVLSAREVERAVRDALSRNGSEAAHYWSDQLNEVTVERVWAWAVETVERVYGAALTPPAPQP